MCENLCIEEQVLYDSKIIKQHIMLRTESQTATDQSHVLADVITIDVGPATGGRKQPWKQKLIKFINALVFYLAGVKPSSPVSMDSEVVFPAPLWPRRTVIWLSNMFIVRSFTACRILLPTLNSCRADEPAMVTNLLCSLSWHQLHSFSVCGNEVILYSPHCPFRCSPYTGV